MSRWSGPLDPYGSALMDFHRGRRDATLRVHSTLGEHDDLPVEVFFREADELFPFERVALGVCRGRVLDVGAGAGVHSMILQDRGLEVRAVEMVPQAVEILRERGVQDVVESDIFELTGEAFDTVLMMMNGVGPVGTLDGLGRYLDHIRWLLAPGGQVLLDSAAPRRADDPVDPDLEGLALPETGDGYSGEAWIQLEYQGELAPPFRELYLGEDLLAERAAAAGWACSFLHRDDHGSWLAQLLPVS